MSECSIRAHRAALFFRPIYHPYFTGQFTSKPAHVNVHQVGSGGVAGNEFSFACPCQRTIVHVLGSSLYTFLAEARELGLVLRRDGDAYFVRLVLVFEPTAFFSCPGGDAYAHRVECNQQSEQLSHLE